MFTVRVQKINFNADNKSKVFIVKASMPLSSRKFGFCNRLKHWNVRGGVNRVILHDNIVKSSKDKGIISCQTIYRKKS